MDHLIRNLREAFNRHGKLHGALDGRVEELVLSDSEDLQILLDPKHVQTLTRILNMAPMNGDPLNLTVNIEADTDLWERDEERTALYLHDNDMEPTLENVAAAILYSGADTPYAKIAIPCGKYCIARISRIEQEANTTGASTFALTKITVPGGWGNKVNVVTFDFPNADISSVEGEENKKVNARVLRYYEPGKNTALGGILMERTA
jgi:hypothetical protein|nr:MAG TPA: hypothetical protein [Caudoviricetes sp.]